MAAINECTLAIAKDDIKDQTLFKIQQIETITRCYTEYIHESIVSSELLVDLVFPSGLTAIIVEFSDFAEMELKKQRAIAELLFTERRYLKILNHYQKHYIDALDGNTKILSKEQYDVLCPKEMWQNILTVHTIFFKHLQTECAKYTYWGNGICIVFEDFLIPYAPLVYQAYFEHYSSNAVNTLVSYENTMDQKWQRFMKYDMEMSSTEEPHILAQSCLVCPNSRLHRYCLILTEIQKHASGVSCKQRTAKLLQRLRIKLSQIENDMRVARHIQ